MTFPIEDAIAGLQVELQTLGSPKPGTALWFTRRAKSTGLTLLKLMLQQGVHQDETIADAFRKDFRKGMLNEPASPS